MTAPFRILPNLELLPRSTTRQQWQSLHRYCRVATRLAHEELQSKGLYHIWPEAALFFNDTATTEIYTKRY
jgi:hypothetical protein